MSITAVAEASEVRVTPDLPSRIRRAIAHQDQAELDLLQPLIRALAYREVTVGEVKALDAEQALWLVAERGKHDGRSARARL
ncbi:MAG TPA: hypothetical protein VFK66_10200 [Oryzihumus sp.]|nr:hypothetical protein [Oryzihumus sp.]